MEWISVEDRLPDDDGSHFDVWVDGDRIPDALYDNDKQAFLNYVSDNDGYFEWREIENVTHWMPLPEPPESK